MKPEVILMYTWDIKGYYDNNICGHVYELIDYYWILKDKFNIKIIFPENYDLDLILEKYNFSESEKNELKEKIIPRPKSGIIKTHKGKGIVLVTDGNLGNFKGFIYGIPVQFSCGKSGLIPKDKTKWYLLHDQRIEIADFQDFSKNPPKKIFNYNKKVLLTKLNKKETTSDAILFYLTANCKYQTPEEINLIIKNKNQKVYIVTDYPFDQKRLDYPQELIKIIDISSQAIDLFSLDFGTYIYTNVARQWDCSNRLIVECYWHQRKVQYKNNYIDQALEIRKADIETNRTELKLTDNISELLFEIIKDNNGI